ncbi:MAG: 3-oxoacyl-ACP reductase FabG [Acidobacteria bacterium]|nr:3-oxoacyl-ACP reductase FabG [Acidobacteriota bacterium]
MPTNFYARRLTGKVAIVTGASRGIGRAIAVRLAREGAAVAVNYRTQAAAAEEVVGEIRDLGEQAVALQADVADREAAGRMAAQTLERFGRIDVLVNNAGIMFRSDILNFNTDEFQQMRATNVGGVVHSVAAVLPAMKAQKSGSIVNLASIAALGTAMQGTTFYAATKAAVNILTKRFALELGSFGITVNAVAPGFIVTDMVAAGRTPEELEKLLATMSTRNMLGRNGRPEDIASVVAFLASADAAFMTGQILTADG